MCLNRATMIWVCWLMFSPREMYGCDSHCKINRYVYGWYSVQWRNLGMLSWHVYVIMIFYCRYVDIRDSFLLGQLLEQRWLWSTLSDGGYRLVIVNGWVSISCCYVRHVKVKLFLYSWGYCYQELVFLVVAYDMWEWDCFVFLGLRSPGSSFELLSTCAHVLFSCGGFGS